MLENRVAVVTGAASGIGLALSERFTSGGASVVMVDIDADRLRAQADRLSADGATVNARVVDVTDAAAVDALAAETVDVFGRVDVLCNNAGIVVGGPAWEITMEDWDRTLGVNLRSVVCGVRSFVPAMRASGDDGHIVNTASMAAFMQLGMVAPYVATKHAVVGLSIALSEDLGHAGSSISVSVVCPGMVATPLVGLGETPADALPADTITADVAADRIVEAMLARQFYVFTHPESVADVEDRFTRALAGFSDS